MPSLGHMSRGMVLAIVGSVSAAVTGLLLTMETTRAFATKPAEARISAGFPVTEPLRIVVEVPEPPAPAFGPETTALAAEPQTAPVSQSALMFGAFAPVVQLGGSRMSVVSEDDDRQVPFGQPATSGGTFRDVGPESRNARAGVVTLLPPPRPAFRDVRSAAASPAAFPAQDGILQETQSRITVVSAAQPGFSWPWSLDGAGNADRDDRPRKPERSLQSGQASWYGPGFHGRKTASGEVFNQNAMTAAHRYLPFGTRVRVVDEKTGRSVVVRINDRGPFAHGRVIDLSKASAAALGMGGLARVKLVSAE